MSKRTRLILWILGIILLFSAIFVIYAIDTNKLKIGAEPNEPSITSVSEVKSLPSPDQSTFNKLYTKILDLFRK
jgi:hypothetical protein